MIGIVIGILAAVFWVISISLARIAGMADRRLEEIQRLAAEREAGVQSGN